MQDKYPDEPYKGLTLAERAKEYGFRIGHSVCVKVLENENATNGVEVDECASLRIFLKQHPEMRNAIVARTSDFYNTEQIFVTVP